MQPHHNEAAVIVADLESLFLGTRKSRGNRRLGNGRWAGRGRSLTGGFWARRVAPHAGPG